MILIAGGTGLLGSQLVRRLTARGLQVRVLTRDGSRASHLAGPLVEVAVGDVRDPNAVGRAMTGVRTVISAIQGFGGADAAGARAVDGDGNRSLIRAATAAGVEHFILLSILGVSGFDRGHPMELGRRKYEAERELVASPLAWTIVRPSAYMETWLGLVGRPLLESGRTRIFGRGRNPINFVAASDVAGFVDLAVDDPALRGLRLDVGGPENITLDEMVRTVEEVTGRSGVVDHVPLPMMRVMSLAMRPFRPVLAGQIQAAIVMDTAVMTFEAAPTRARFPSIPSTTLAEVARRDFGAPART